MPSDPRGTLHPQVAALFENMTAGGGERVLEVEALRAGFAALEETLALAGPSPWPQDRTVQIDGPGGPLRARVLAPEGARDLPVVVYFHGGGYVVLSPEPYAPFCANLALEIGCVVVSVDYRLSPEHAFPDPQLDGLAAYRWAREHAAEIGGDPERVAVAGDSAGANLAAAVCLRTQAAGERVPDAALLICPWLDMRLDSPSYHTFSPDDVMIDAPLMILFRDAFVKPDQFTDPFASPVLADLSAFPPSLVLTGGIDPLRDDGARFADGLRAAGRNVHYVEFAGMPHDWLVFPGIDDAVRARQEIARFAREAL